jgi:hypothetical protein
LVLRLLVRVGVGGRRREDGCEEVEEEGKVRNVRTALRVKVR